MTQTKMTLGIGSRKKSLILKSLRVVDLVFEVADARCPESSRSPAIFQLIKHKRQILILNKADLADIEATRKWLAFFREQGITAVAVDSQRGNGFEELWKQLAVMEAELKQKLDKRGRLARELRAAVVGIPNTGKSSFLNKLVGRKIAATGDRPGITKGPQWVHLKGKISVLDTPGVLPPRIETGDEYKLISIGAVDSSGYEVEEIGEKIIGFLEENYPENLRKYLGLREGSPLTLENLARQKNFLLPGGEPDLNRTGVYLLKLFRNGELGRITLELPQVK